MAKRIINGTGLVFGVIVIAMLGCASEKEPPRTSESATTQQTEVQESEVQELEDQESEVPMESGEMVSAEARPSSESEEQPATPPQMPVDAEPAVASEAAPETPADQAASSETAASQPTDSASEGSAPFWPAFQGPQGDNISTETGLLQQWPEEGPPLLWTAEGIGEGYASVSLANGLIYTAGNLDDKTVVTAFGLDGEVRWQAPAGNAWTGSYPGTRSTPTIDGDRLYYQNPLGELSCLKAATGEPIWQVNVLERFGAKNIQWALAESNLIDGNRVISTPCGPKTAIVALDKMTGETVWQSESADGDAAGYATATLAEYQGKRLLFNMTAKAVVCVDADSGHLYWRFPHETKYDVNATKPIFHDGQLFVTSGYGTGSQLLRVKVDGDQVDVENVWKNGDLDNHHGGVILLDGYLYGSDSRRAWICLDWKDGRTVYSERGVGKGSLTYADGMLYTLSENGQMGLMPATPEASELAGQFKLPAGGQGKSWAYPVVCDGRLYLRHGDFLYCYNVRK